MRPGAPLRNQEPEPGVLLAPSGVQRRHLGELWRVGQPVRFEMRENLPAPARERIEQRAVVARNLEPRHPSDERRSDGVAERLEPLCECVAVVRPDELLAATDLRRLEAPPLAL